MNSLATSISLSLLALVATHPAFAAELNSPVVTRTAPDTLAVTWSSSDPVDVFVTDRPDAKASDATIVSHDDRDGSYLSSSAGTQRRYFLLRDSRTGETLRVAERVLPLEQGSNFRDIGGYAAAGGKHVRWGRIYRSGATPLLTDADVAQVRALGLADLVDLRSSEERALAPTRLDGIRYSAVGYSMTSMMPKGANPGQLKNGGAVYRIFPKFLAPQLKVLFDDLLANAGPVAYNCSAGQDRTGFVTAMILSSLSVPRDTIIQDYHLSTLYRRPAYEAPKIDPAAFPGNPAAAMFARYQRDPAAVAPQSLKEADGKSFLASAFDEIETHWGSVDSYLEREVGLDKVKIRRLKALYLE
ncbi:MAG: protein-tyrosine phosphatase [Sphingomonadales bacterium]|nr:protein-tyrosine phosphatase [Sphingomonadales bacterium]